MTGDRYWVRISEDGVPLGAGLLLTRVYVLTALHCLREASSESARLGLELADGRRLSGRVLDSVKEIDLALIAVEDAHRHDLPPAPPTDWPRPYAAWRCTYCPPHEQTQLSGVVSHAPIAYRSAEGGEFTGIQLTVDQQLGDYSGYSGGPVDTDPDGAPGRPVVGILMEQPCSREDPTKGSNVLVAASVRHAMELFPHFSVDWLRNGGPVTQPSPPVAPEPAGSSEAAEDASRRRLERDAEAVLRSLRRWEEAGLVPVEEAQDERAETLRDFRGRLLGGGPDG
ncbi:S1 family peptidase [Streptomyces sp. NPDC054940]